MNIISMGQILDIKLQLNCLGSLSLDFVCLGDKGMKKLSQ